MTAEEIRAIATDQGDFHVKIPLFLREIAAQLAEANAVNKADFERRSAFDESITGFFKVLTQIAGTMGITASSQDVTEIQ